MTLGSDSIYTSGNGSIEFDTAVGLANGSDTFNVANASSIEIGTAGEPGTNSVAPAAGSFTVDTGSRLTDGGSITAPHIVVNGTLEVGNSETLNLYGGTYTYNSTLGKYVYVGGLTGNGTLQIDNNAQLTIGDGVDSTSHTNSTSE